MREKKEDYNKGEKKGSVSRGREYSKSDRGGSKGKFVRKEKSFSSPDTKKPGRSVKERFSESTDNSEKSERNPYKGRKSGDGDSRKSGSFHKDGSKDKFVRKEKSFFSSDTKRSGRSVKGRSYESTDNTEKEERSTYRGKRTGEADNRKPGSFRTTRSRSTFKSEPKQKRTEDGSIRLNKYIANAGICSRREADRLIESGAVSVNGKIVTELGIRVSSNDVVNYGGETLRKEKLVYLLLNKPKDYITTVDDPQGRKTVMALIGDACRERIYPVGRLDRATTGLLLFTNDGDIAKKLVHPRFGIKKIYHVELDKALSKTDMVKIAQGIELEDGIAKVDAISYDGDGSDKKSIGIEIHSGKNRIVRRIFESFGYDVRKLDRVYFAGLTKKDLPRGKWRFLTPMEVNMLKMLK